MKLYIVFVFRCKWWKPTNNHIPSCFHDDTIKYTVANDNTNGNIQTVTLQRQGAVKTFYAMPMSDQVTLKIDSYDDNALRISVSEIAIEYSKCVSCLKQFETTCSNMLT